MPETKESSPPRYKRRPSLSITSVPYTTKVFQMPAVQSLDFTAHNECPGKGLRFYRDVLGFQLKLDTPMGGEYRWLTAVSRDAPEGVQLLLELDEHPAANPFKAGARG